MAKLLTDSPFDIVNLASLDNQAFGDWIPMLLHPEINRSIKQNAIEYPQSVFAHLGVHRSGVPAIILEENATM